MSRRSLQGLTQYCCDVIIGSGDETVHSTISEVHTLHKCTEVHVQ